MSFGHRVPVGVDKLSQQQPAVRACPASVSSARASAAAHGRDEAATSLVRRLFMLSSLGATLGSMDDQDVLLRGVECRSGSHRVEVCRSIAGPEVGRNAPRRHTPGPLRLIMFARPPRVVA